MRTLQADAPPSKAPEEPVALLPTEPAAGRHPVLVSVVIPCYNHAHFLDEAIQSVLAQTYPSFEIIVVDDGSTDHTAAVAQGYPQVRYVWQHNQGLAAARNTGTRESRGTYVVFLDADDLLCPTAVETGVRCFEANPRSAFVSGVHVRVGPRRESLETFSSKPIERDHYLALLRGNYIGMHAAVMYRRDILMLVRGFDTSLPACEDYDLYLRIARNFPVSCHDTIVAEYRIHGSNMSSDTKMMLQTVQRVLQAQWRYVKTDRQRRLALKEGLRSWQGYYGHLLVQQTQATLPASGGVTRVVKKGWTLVHYAPKWLTARAVQRLRRGGTTLAKHLLPARLRRTLRLAGSSPSPPVGRFGFGSFRRVTPFSRVFGYDRGLPVDRYYIERFLTRNAGDIRGRVLEIGDNTYTHQFGRARVEKSDVLHVSPGNPHATLVGDLATADHIPSEAFDCIILTQTLHLIYELRAAMATLYRILKPGGVLLATVPGLSHIDHGEWGHTWYWSFTSQSAQRLFEEFFPSRAVSVETHGNVLVASAFLYGLSKQELRTKELDYHDPDYQVIIALRAVKPRESTPVKHDADRA